MELKYGKTE